MVMSIECFMDNVLWFLKDSFAFFGFFWIDHDKTRIRIYDDLCWLSAIVAVDKATITVHGHDICISGKAMASLRLSVSWTYGMRVLTLLRETLHGWQGMAMGNCK